MLTTTHILVAAAATTRPGMKRWQIALGWFSGFLPDMSVFAMVVTARLTGMGGGNLWRRPTGLYWQEPWQLFSALSNSMPLYVGLVVVGILVRRLYGKARSVGTGLVIFGTGALLHVLLDFPVHTDDAHIHFWPFSDWRFHSMVSYYQREHFGQIVGTVETVAGVGLALFVAARFPSWRVRVAAAICALPYFLNIGFLF